MQRRDLLLANRSNRYAHQRKALLHCFQRIFPAKHCYTAFNVSSQTRILLM
ncbi:MAG: hypothetical protein HRU34_08465 [Richelia sp.]|nr:hypothetical protein [Richelia sp.]